MADVADVVRRFAGSYLAAHGASMLPSHRRALADIQACRTEALGGHLERCTACGVEVHHFHSCRNRSCPKCHGQQTQAWLEKRQAEMLPVPYFHVTVTVPEDLRAVLRRHQREGYGVLMAAAAKAIGALAGDPRIVGGTVGVLAVLHTWTQQLIHHPHVHCLVTGGGLSDDGTTWHPARRRFLMPGKALAKAVRGRFRAGFARHCPGVTVPRSVWRQPWVVHVTPWGDGEPAVLAYLARYVFRIAITDRRILAVDDHGVTFQYRDREAGQTRTCRISGHEFLRRYLQHVLPKGFHKVRYFGLWHPSKRDQAHKVRVALALDRKTTPPPCVTPPAASDPPPPANDGPDPAPPPASTPSQRRCPRCQTGRLVFLRRVIPIRPRPPP